MKAMTETVIRTNFKGGPNLLFTVGGFFNERENAGADWLDLFINNLNCLYCFKNLFVVYLHVFGKIYILKFYPRRVCDKFHVFWNMLCKPR